MLNIKDLMNILLNHKLKLFATLLLVLFIFSFLLGRSSVSKQTSNFDYERTFKESNDKVYEKFVQKIEVKNMQNHLKYLTSIPHMAGTPGDKLSADYVYNEWKAQGLDSVQIIDYDAFLSFPDDYRYNR
jgi:hypothetical protein